MAINHPIGADSSRESRRRKSIASTFRRSDDYEAMLKLKAAAEGGNLVAHQQMEGLSPATRLAFGSYQAAREAVIAEGIINADGSPTS